MSYILDALRRADSDRERGAVPKLFAQPLPRVSIEPEAALLGRPWAWVVAGAVLAAALGVVAWRLAAPAAPLAVAEPPAALPAAPVPTALPPATTANESRPSPPPAKPTVAEVVRPARKLPAAAGAPTPRATAKAEVAPATQPELAASAGESRVYARNELPGEVQRELPTLAIGGASYSESPANRMLIINGQVFHEGDKLTPDLVLEQIKLKAAVLRYKGYRYGVSY